MAIKIGEVEALFRYPVKSMSDEAVRTAELGWHGLDGDRRLAFRRINDHSGFPWLTASKLPELILFAPLRRTADGLPTHVRRPEGEELTSIRTRRGRTQRFLKRWFARENKAGVYGTVIRRGHLAVGQPILLEWQ